jgi:hypothetical protein
VTTTVADQVYLRVVALMQEEGVSTRAEAIRRVAAEMDRSVSATSSAFYSAARRSDPTPSAPQSGSPAPRGRSSAQADATRLYAEMLPLVEAGASVEQAARRFGDDDEAAAEIAAGFTRWAVNEADAASQDDSDDLAEAQMRIHALEAENRRLNQDLARAAQALSRARAVIESGLGSLSG